MLDDKENSLTRHRWVRIMADFSADGVWNQQGELCDLADLPVSDALKHRISAWMDWYDREADPDDRNGISFDLRQFSEQGLAIAQDVKRELLDWTVVYFDELRYDESSRAGRPRIGGISNTRSLKIRGPTSDGKTTRGAGAVSQGVDGLRR